MKREFETVGRMAERAGVRIQQGMSGGGGVRAGAMRETLVLLREISRGNWTRVPGSFSILLGQLGLFEIATTAAVGVLGTFATVLGGVALAAGIVYGRIQLLSKSLTGLQLPDFKPEYIAQHLQKVNQVAEGWKQINKEVQQAVDLHNSAGKAAERAADATKRHFEHLRKMNALEKDPAKKAAKELEIDAQERQAQLANDVAEKSNLANEGSAKKAAADAINVNSKEHDQQLLAKTKADADAAEKFLKEHHAFGSAGDKAKAVLGGGLFPGSAQAAYDAMSDADKSKVADANARIKAHKEAVDRTATNDELRAQKAELTKGAGDSFSKAAVLALKIKEQARINEQANADEAAESAAGLAADRRGKPMHGSVNSLQQVGAYAAPATALLDVNRQMNQKLGILVKHATQRDKIAPRKMGAANYGG